MSIRIGEAIAHDPPAANARLLMQRCRQGLHSYEKTPQIPLVLTLGQGLEGWRGGREWAATAPRLFDVDQRVR